MEMLPLMAKEVEDAEIGTITRRERQTMEAAKKQLNEAKETYRGRATEAAEVKPRLLL